ncbi:hypothetical protein [Deinococcus ruber]|uniref:Uncharacterized protein n=1 Tax=Deinococcus ruber TaxID=1848197 RepID=A0A918F5J3_9DEIO|nr:hypothetical protein [Deinococcus ruber]GGR09945.1 hypothetical protein GCM10008957_23400 [Deinococcus ruber]
MQDIRGGKAGLLQRLEKYIAYHVHNNLKSIGSIHDLALRVFAHLGPERSFLNNASKGILKSCQSSALDIIHARYSIDLLYSIVNEYGAMPPMKFVTEEKRLYEYSVRLLVPQVVWDKDNDRTGFAFAGISKPDYMQENEWAAANEIFSTLQKIREQQVDFEDEDSKKLNGLISNLIKEMNLGQ